MNSLERKDRRDDDLSLDSRPEGVANPDGSAIVEAEALSIIDRLADALIVLSGDSTILFANMAAERLFERPREKLLGMPFGHTLILGETAETSLLTPKGQSKFAEIRVSEIMWQGRPCQLAALRDITEKKQAEDQIDYLNNFDQDTTLPNERQFLRLLAQRLSDAGSRDALIGVAVVEFQDLGLPDSADDPGDGRGADVFARLAELLKDLVAGNEGLAHLGLGRFACFSSGKDDIDDVYNWLLSLMDRLEDSLASSAALSAGVFFKAGGAVFPDNGPDADALLRNASEALAHAKRSKGLRYTLYDAEQSRTVLRYRSVLDRVRRAIDTGAFDVHYQPKARVRDDRIVGAEALVRWADTDDPLYPDEFIPVAENAGLIDRITDIVLDRVVTDFESLGTRTGFDINLNLSGYELSDPSLPDRLLGRLAKSSVRSENLVLEVTETHLMHDLCTTRTLLTELIEHGFTVALDDFGTGFSSLSYLAALPIGLLKIDRSLITPMVESRQAAALVDAIIRMAHSLDLQVIAEGIETQEELIYLRAYRCDQYQGYHLARPMPFEDLRALIA